MITFKGFDRGLRCRGYQFEPYRENICDHAQAHQRGFHSAENPLDVLTYYPDPKTSEYWICEALGDIDEDGIDSKVSSTVLIPRMKISIDELIIFGLAYAWRKQDFVRNAHEMREAHLGYAVAIGARPAAKGQKAGDVLGFLRTTDGEYRVFIVGEGGTKPDVWYNIDMKEVRMP